MGQALTITRNIKLIELDRLLKKEKKAAVARRLQAIRSVLDGSTIPEAAEILGLPERTLRRWVRRFNEAGAAGLRDQPRPGQPPKLPLELVENFTARVRAGAQDKDGVCALRGPQIQRILAEEYEAKYSLGGTYLLLHRLGFSSLVPRPEHPKGDPAAREAFKKTSCPRP